jgi:hypothetical protein
LDGKTVKESHLNDRREGKRVVRNSLSAFADRLRAKADVRRKRDVKRAAGKTQTNEEMTSRDLHGEPLSLHIVPLAHQRNPRGRDGRRL